MKLIDLDGIYDRVEHFTAYAVLAALPSLDRFRCLRPWAIAAFLLVLGALLESLNSSAQAVPADRTTSWRTRPASLPVYRDTDDQARIPPLGQRSATRHFRQARRIRLTSRHFSSSGFSGRTDVLTRLGNDGGPRRTTAHAHQRRKRLHIAPTAADAPLSVEGCEQRFAARYRTLQQTFRPAGPQLSEQQRILDSIKLYRSLHYRYRLCRPNDRGLPRISRSQSNLPGFG